MFPELVGPYRVEGPAPGAHRTCLAHHRDSGRQVVIKCYRGVLSDAEQHAVSTVAGSVRRKDPSVVPLEEIFLGQDATYLVAPRVIGHDLASVLRAVCRQRRITAARLHVDATLILMIEACVAFGAVAERRDHMDHAFSPADLFVTPDGRLKLTDPRWHYLDGILPGGSHSMAADLAYQLPDDESASVESARAFSIATLTWELLTGYRLFRREDPIEALKATRQRSIPSASGINSAVPPELSAALNRVLAFPASNTLLSLCAELRRSAPATLEHSTVSTWVAALFAGDAEESDPPSGDHSSLSSIPTGETMDWVESEPNITATDLPAELRTPAEDGLAWLGDEPSASVPPARPISVEPRPHAARDRASAAWWAAPFILIAATMTIAVLWATARRENPMTPQSAAQGEVSTDLGELAALPVTLEDAAMNDVLEDDAAEEDTGAPPTQLIEPFVDEPAGEVVTLDDLEAAPEETTPEGAPPSPADISDAHEPDAATRGWGAKDDSEIDPGIDGAPEPTAVLGRIVVLAPARATVLVDGQPVGTGHLERELAVGSHVISVAGDGLASDPTSVRIQPGRTAMVAFE